MNKEVVIKYFDDLKVKLDLLVELFFIDNQLTISEQTIDKVNATRESYLKEIRECLEHNIVLLRENKSLEKLPNEQLFVKFCFLIETPIDTTANHEQFGWLLISTDIYLTETKIMCFQELLKLMAIKNVKPDYFQELTLHKCVDTLFQKKVNFNNKFI